MTRVNQARGAAMIGATVAQLPVAAAPSSGDLVVTSQDGGNTVVPQTLAALATFIAAFTWTTEVSPVVLAANTTLDRTQHLNTVLLCTSSLTLVAPSSFINVGPGFRCRVYSPASGGTVTFGSGIIGATAVAPGQTAEVFSATDGTNNYVVAALIGASSSASTSITVTQVGTTPGTIANQTANAPFTVAGALSGYTSAPALEYSNVGPTGPWQFLPAGATTSSTAYSFTNPGMVAGTGSKVYVKDASGLTAVGSSSAFTVTAAANPTVTITPVNTQAVTAGNTSTNVSVTAALTAYASAPTPSQFTLSQTGAGGSFSALPSGATVTSVSGTTYTLAFTLIGVTGGTENLCIKDTGNGNTLSAVVSFNVEQVTGETNVPVSGTQGAAITNFTAAFVGLTTAYACMHNTSTGDETRTGFTSNGSLSLTPAGNGTYTVRIYDAVSGGNLLYECASFSVAAIPTITLTQPSAQYWSTAFAIAGTYTGTAPSNVDVQVDGAGAWTTLTGFTASAGAWGATVPNTLITSGTPHTLKVRETNATAVVSSASGNIAFSAAPAFALTSVTPAAIGVVGSNMTFNFAYTGSVGAVTATVDGTAVTVSNVTGSGGTGSFTIVGPALNGTNGPLHSLSASGTSGAAQTTLFAANATASAGYNIFASTDFPTTHTGTNFYAGPAYSYTGTSTEQLPGTSNNFVVTDGTGGNNYPPNGFTKTNFSQTAAQAGWSTSSVVPPGPLPAYSGGASPSHALYVSGYNGSVGAWDIGGPIYNTGTYYLWFISPDNQYAFCAAGLPLTVS